MKAMLKCVGLMAVLGLSSQAMALSLEVYASNNNASPQNRSVLDTGSGTATVLGSFDNPGGVAVVGQKIYWGYRSANDTIAVYNPATSSFEAPIAAPYSGGRVEAMATGPDGFLYAADANGDDIYKINVSSGVGAMFANSVSHGQDIGNTHDMEFSPDGTLLYISDDIETVRIFQGPNGVTPGAFVSSFGTVGPRPRGIAVRPDGNVLVAERGSPRAIREYTSAGAFVSTFVDITGVNPVDIDLDDDGSVWVTSIDLARLRVYAPDGLSFTDYTDVPAYGNGSTTFGPEQIALFPEPASLALLGLGGLLMLKRQRKSA